MVRSYSGITITKKVLVFCGRDLSDGGLKLLMELVLGLNRGTQSRNVDSQNVHWAGESCQEKREDTSCANGWRFDSRSRLWDAA